MKKRFGSRAPVAFVSLAVLAAPATAHAENPNSPAAQRLFDRGRELLLAGRTSEACPKFEESQQLDPALGTLLNLADCYEKEQRLTLAWRKFSEAIAVAHAEGHADAERVAGDRAQKLGARLPKLAIQVAAETTPGLLVKRDGAIVPRSEWNAPIPADPGAHEIAVSAPGRAPWQTSVVLDQAGSVATVNVPELAAAPGAATAATADAALATPNSDSGGGLGAQRMAALTVGGVGVAGVVVGSVFGLKSLSKRSEADRHCNGSHCRDQLGVDLRADARSAGNVSTVAFVVGAVGLAGGAVLWFTAKPANAASDTALRLGLGLGGATLERRW